MRVLITGATGFVGSHVLRQLLADGMEAHVLRSTRSDPWRIADVLPRVRVWSAEPGAPEALAACVREICPELCLHMAWCAEPGTYLNSLDNLRCLSASLQLAEQAARAGCTRFVGIGSGFEYDATRPAALSEESPTKPLTLYAASKLGCWLALEQVGRVTGMQVAWLRLFSMYGPAEDPRRLVPSVITALLNDQEMKLTRGEQARDFLHVEDVAAAIAAAARSPLQGVINIGSGVPTRVRDCLSLIGRILGREQRLAFGAVPLKAFDPMMICADATRLRTQLHWTPRHDLEGGLRQTVGWWERRLRSAAGVAVEGTRA